MAQTSYEQGQGQQGPAQTQGTELVRGSSGGSRIRVVPMLSVSERYDSNILRSSGGKVSDYITDIRPGAVVDYSNDLLDVSLRGSAISAIHVNNPGLNYIGGFGSLNAALDRISDRVVRGLGVNFSESITYYPEQPGFVTPETPESDFTRGIQARRSNAISSVAIVRGTYALNPLAQLSSSYSFQTRRFLGQADFGATDAPIALFNVSTHMLSAGPTYRISTNHTVGASYSFRQIASEPNTGGTSVVGQKNTIHGAMAIWRSELSRELTAEISPGASVATFAPDSLIWTMQASLRWNDPTKSVALTYSRGLYPSFYGQAFLLVSNVIGGTFSYNLSDKWSVMLGANYALNTRTGAQTNLRFESIGVNGSVRYSLFEGVFVAITGSNGDFTIEQPSATRKYDRQVGMLTLTAEWK